MSLEALSILKKGLKQTFSSTGLKLIGAFYVLNVVGQIINDSLIAQSVIPSAGAEVPTSLAITAVPTPVWGALLAVSVVANIWLVLGTLRNLVNENFDSLNREYFSEDLTMPALNMVAGSIVFSVIVALGTLAFIVPGIYLLVSLLFWSIFVAVEDDTFIDALKNSWELTKGNKIDLFLIGLGVFAVGFLASLIVALPNIVLSSASPAASSLLTLAVNSFGTVFGLVTLAHAYNELQ